MREQIRNRYRDAADLAQVIDPNYVITPAIRLTAQRIEVALRKPRHNLVITAPPQEMKSTLCAIYTPLRAFQLNPNSRVILVTYAEQLALDHSRICRGIVSRHGSGVIDPLTGVEVEDKLGFALSATNSKVDTWSITNGKGGLTAVGIHGTIIGRSADLLIIDDPYKDMAEADSDTQRKKVSDWMRTVAKSRRSPNASIILIQSRWHPDDLAGEVLSDERLIDKRFRTWHHVNIPAISEDGIPDALNRPPGVVMESALKRTREEFESTRREVGERVWYAMYQGSPRSPSGGLFQADWFIPHRDVPEHPVASIVSIDPAETGKRDEAGIIGGYLCPDGTVLLAEDWSGRFTSDQWARRAVLLALTIGAREIAMEAYNAATTYEQMLKRAWRDVHREAIAKFESGEELTEIDRAAMTAQMPFTIHHWRGKRPKADSVERSALLRQALEIKKAATVEFKMAVFEDQAIGWQSGQHCPDRVAAAVIGHERLMELGSGRLTVASPVLGERPMGAPAWMRRRLSG